VIARRAFVVMPIAWLLFLLEPLSHPGLAFPFFCIVFAITVVFGIIGLLWAFERRPLSPLRLLIALVHPLAALALLLLFLGSQSPLNPLFRLRFELSRPALEANANAALAGQTVPTPVRLGLFLIERIDVFDSEVRLMSGGCGIVDECGLMYRPGPPPARRYKAQIKPLGGPWFLLYAVF
jgi:hypothetical protein